MRFQKARYDESEIFALIKEGDAAAFEKIYNTYSQRLSIKLVQILKSEDLAQDVLQDVFIKVWEMRAEIKPELSFSSFLYKIATNMSYNVYRRALKEQLILKQNVQSESYDHVEQQLREKECHELIQQALNNLTVRQREVYTLHKMEGLSYKEIEVRLQIGKSAINHHIQEANKHLRFFLKPYGILLAIFLISMSLS
ncbi:sigma-70 family RNA polymerase sigma factor [Sphingobacterium sp. SGG-5]|uniref:RNA polymerase sigma factor n=1 Tax=Sphingobacterium sp. SGG-5 TaxID=2710881 RepID=UPI0013ED2C7E|nr:sigma-70 family RNA polymerase sigma factor [Sphingobacterium sp. SGG-5]NGM63585.1 sigma-70 family RNA polymerase sigma factor [Sphingobacterium sp. SGG-5]